ncbi:MAG: hypothetical protein GTO60_08380, partial [Gammaproteobacteria bacterium]|nr:hypothetical protein [Gammaproteobacteria bacterium]
MTETGTPGIKEKKDSPRRRVMVFDLAAPNNVKILARLCELKNWIPVHWFGSLPKQGDLIRNLFPNVEYYSKRNLILRQFPNSLPHTEWPRRDADVIQHLAKYDPVLYPVFLREARSLYGMDNMAEYHEVITT